MRSSKICSAAPFKGWAVYGPTLNKKEGRWQVVLQPPEAVCFPICMMYAKYVLSMHLGRHLTREEQVDHIDGDCLNDSVTNLQVLTLQQNVAKHCKDSGLSHVVVTLRCPGCGSIFSRRKKNTFLAKAGVFTACSRRCSGLVRQQLQVGGSAELSQALAANVVEERSELWASGSTG